MSRHHRNALSGGFRLFWYRIEQVLGSGGFGITYLATDTNLERRVAIKEYLPADLAVREDDSSLHPVSDDRYENYSWGLERFIVEARTLAQFKHPNIVAVQSVFEANNTAYMVMDYETGAPLAELAKFGRIGGEARLLSIAHPLLDALEYMHQREFIHRDIKPANIYVREDGSPVLLDFGSARRALGDRTRTLTAMVTQGYSPYEQYDSGGGKQGPWTDIYAFGATLYACLRRGRGPIDAIARGNCRIEGKDDPLETAAAAGAGRYTPELLAAIDAALAFLPGERPQCVADWRPMFPPRPESPVTPGAVDHDADTAVPAAAVAVRASARREASPKPEFGAKPKRRRSRPLLLGLLALTAMVGALWVGRSAWLGERPAPPERTTAPAAATLSAKGAIARDLLARATASLDAGKLDKAGFLREEAARAGAQPPALVTFDRRFKAARQAVLAAKRLAEAERALKAGRREEASASLAAATEAGADPKAISVLREGLLAAERAARAADAVRRADVALTAGKLDKAGFLLDEATQLGAEGESVIALRKRLGAARGQAARATRINPLLARAGREIDAGQLDAAAATVADLTGIGATDARLKPLNARLATARRAADKGARVANLLGRGKAALTALRLTTPPGDNALEHYRAALAIESENADARKGLDRIVERYLALAEQAAAKQEFDKARGYLDRADTVGAGADGIKAARERIVVAESAAKASALLAGAGAALDAGDIERAARMLGEAAKDGAQGQPLAMLRARLEQARQAKAEAEKRHTGKVFRDRLQDGTDVPEMVFIKAGCYQMGSPESEIGRDDNERLHRVCVKDFALGKYEVTFDEYDAYARAAGRPPPADQGWGRGRRPVINVSWNDAVAYAKWLSSQTGKRYRLPTEAEWEFAARAGGATAYPWGGEVSRNHANCRDCGSRWDTTAPVGSFAANAWGLFDTTGNVWEWTCSLFGQTYGGAEKTCGSGYRRRVIRGGSWYDRALGARSASRLWHTPDDRDGYLGFRLAQGL